MTRRVGVVGNRRYPGLPGVLETLQRRAPELGMTLVFEEELYDLTDGSGGRLEEVVDVDALLTLGGDGTMLRGARFLHERQVPILGVNLGRLGFLTTCGGDEMERGLERLAAGEYLVERRMALQAEAARERFGGRWRAVNDVVLHKGGFARVVRLAVSVDGEEIGAYSADGLIISTPTGSTAYNLSCGGPVVVPTVESLVLTPISPHTLGIRPLVLPRDARVAVRAEDTPDELLVTVDGQVGTTFAPGDTLVVSRASAPVLLARFEDSSFFTRMRRKLGWGGLRDRDESERC